MLLVDDLAAGGTKNLRHTPRGLVTLGLSDAVKLKGAVIHLQFFANGSWDSLFPISMSPNCKLMSPDHS